MKPPKRLKISGDEATLRERERVRDANEQALITVLEKTGWTIRAKDFADWRATALAAAEWRGFNKRVTILATNGILALFTEDKLDERECECGALPMIKTVELGHLSAFDGEVKPRFSMALPWSGGNKPASKPRVSKAKAPSARAIAAKALLAKLDELL